MTNRGADFDGEHRISDSQAPSDPAGASGGPDFGALDCPIADYGAAAPWCPDADDPDACCEAYARASGHVTMMHSGMLYAYPMTGYPSSLLAVHADAPDDPIESAGIRAGEIVGYRAWRVKSLDSLTSMHIEDYTWAPGQVHRSSDVYRGDGFYAFNAPELVLQEFESWVGISPVVYGTVAMWGEVVEHERGWRSEYAAIKSFDSINGGFFKRRSLRRLRKTFGVQR